MTSSDVLQYLQAARNAVVWKLEGLSERDARRPLTPTGSNLLGLVKHLALVELEYFGDVVDRPYDEPMTRVGDEPNADMWARAEESVEDVVGLYRRAWAHTAATVEALGPDAPCTVPWWGPGADTTVGTVLVHVLAETQRHAGHADLLRELVDGSAGLRASGSNLPDVDAAWWTSYRERLQGIADRA